MSGKQYLKNQLPVLLLNLLGVLALAFFDRHRDLPSSHFLDRFGLDCGCSLLSDGLFFFIQKDTVKRCW